MTVVEQIKILLGREVEVEEVTFKGQKGYLPIYFNYTFKNNVSEVFDTDKEKCLEKFLSFLTVHKGDTNGTETDSE